MLSQLPYKLRVIGSKGSHLAKVNYESNSGIHAGVDLSQILSNNYDDVIKFVILRTW